jgi:WD40 repeat protein
MTLKKLIFSLSMIIASVVQAMEKQIIPALSNEQNPLIDVNSSHDIQKLILEYAFGWEENGFISNIRPVNSIAYSLDNRYLIMGRFETKYLKPPIIINNAIISRRNLANLDIYNAETNEHIKIIDLKENTQIQALLPLHDGNCLIGSSDKNQSGVLGLLTIQNSDSITYTELNIKLAKIDIMAYSSSRQIAITCPDGFIVGKLQDGTFIQTHKPLKGLSYRPTALAFSPNGQYIACGANDKTMTILDTTDFNTMCTLDGYKSYVFNIVWISNIQLISLHDRDRTMRTWDLSDFKKPRDKTSIIPFYQKQLVSVSPQDNYVMCFHNPKSIALLTIFNTQTKQQIQTINSESPYIHILSMSSDGKYIALKNEFKSRINIWKNSILPLLIKHEQLKKK